MVKSYLRYGPAAAAVFGVVCSPDAQVVYDWSGRFAVTGCLERVVIWNIRQGAPVCQLVAKGNNSPVTCLCMSPNKRQIAVGYADGSIRLWEWAGSAQASEPVTLTGHRAGVTTLCFEAEGKTARADTVTAVGQLLCSGGKDGKIIIWDTIEQKGLYRLQGHKDQITQCQFLSSRGKRAPHADVATEATAAADGRGDARSHGLGLLSSSKDGLMKVWDLETQHCVQTVVGHRREIWSFCANRDETRIYTGTSDSQIRIWELLWPSATSVISQEEEMSEGEAAESRKAVHAYGLPFVHFLGSVPREAKERVMQLKLSPSGGMLACQSNDRRVEFFSVFEPKEMNKRAKRRIRRVHKKREARVAEGKKPETDAVPQFAGSDEVVALYQIRAKHKVRSVDFAPFNPQVVMSLYNNSIEVYDLTQSASKISTQLTQPGHGGDIRSLAISSDNRILLSTSASTAKMWNVKTTNCIRTLETGFGLCSAFVPGNRHVLIGTKEGNIELYNVASGDLEGSFEAHAAEVWSLCVTPDQQGLVSGGADKELKFWRFDLVSSGKRKVVSLQHTKTVVMEHDILSVLYSNDMRYVAVALLDNTVKVFYADTMKFFLSLFGHSLPVMSMDISSDSTLVATGSADKNVKLWGLDFGDCHRSLFAHDDSVMQVKFVPNTHYFFTAGKDGTVKYWDGDTIQVLRGHHSQIWSLTLSNDAEFIVTGSNDRSLRIWNRTEEQVFIEEERENELEQLFQSGVDENDLGEGAQESAAAGAKTLETIQAGEQIMDALELAREEKKRWSEYERAVEATQGQRSSLAEQVLGKRLHSDRQPELPAAPKPNQFLQGKSPAAYVLSVVKKIPANNLEQALMVLPFADTLVVFEYLLEWLQNGLAVELCCKCLFMLLSLHHNQIVTNKSLVATLTELKEVARQRLQEHKSLIGFNKAAMQFMQRSIEQKSEESLFYTSIAASADKRSRKRRKKTHQAS